MENTLSDFVLGQRVQLHPVTDLWMRGARYGIVTRIGRVYVSVKLDATGRTHLILPRDLQAV